MARELDTYERQSWAISDGCLVEQDRLGRVTIGDGEMDEWPAWLVHRADVTALIDRLVEIRERVPE